MFKRIVKYFIPPEVWEKAADLRAERIFITVILISCVADFLGIGLAASLQSAILIYLVLANALMCLMLAYFYKLGINKLFIGHFFIAQHAISFCFQAWAQGGLISPGSAAFFLLPAVAMLMMGRRAATTWLVLATAILVGFYMYQSTYGAPEIGYDPELREYLFFSGVLGTTITIFIILLAYENNRNARIRELHDKNLELIKAQAEVTAQKKLKDRVFAIVSHDLRGPIHMLSGLSKVGTSLLERKEYNELMVMMEQMRKSSSQVSTLLDNLLNWASQELKEIPYNPEQIDVNELIQQLITMFEPMGRAKSIQLINAITEDATIWADLNCTSTIFRNLIQNAIKFTQEDGQVSISVEKKGEYVGIKVTDTGLGMESEKVRDLFAFSEGHVRYGTAGEKGVGLGLRLVHEFTKINRGNVEVESAKGKGSSFTVFLPVSAA